MTGLLPRLSWKPAGTRRSSAPKHSRRDLRPTGVTRGAGQLASAACRPVRRGTDRRPSPQSARIRWRMELPRASAGQTAETNAHAQTADAQMMPETVPTYGNTEFGREDRQQAQEGHRRVELAPQETVLRHGLEVDGRVLDPARDADHLALPLGVDDAELVALRQGRLVQRDVDALFDVQRREVPFGHDGLCEHIGRSRGRHASEGHRESPPPGALTRHPCSPRGRYH